MGNIGSGRARARVDLAGVCRAISGVNARTAANQNTSIPPDRGLNNIIQ